MEGIILDLLSHPILQLPRQSRIAKEMHGCISNYVDGKSVKRNKQEHKEIKNKTEKDTRGLKGKERLT